MPSMFEFERNAEVPGLVLLFQEMLETDMVSMLPKKKKCWSRSTRERILQFLKTHIRAVVFDRCIWLRELLVTCEPGLVRVHLRVDPNC